MGLIQDFRERKLTGCRGCDAARKGLYKGLDLWQPNNRIQAASTHDSFNASSLGAYIESPTKARGDDAAQGAITVSFVWSAANFGPGTGVSVFLVGDWRGTGGKTPSLADADNITGTFTDDTTENISATRVFTFTNSGDFSNLCATQVFVHDGFTKIRFPVAPTEMSKTLKKWEIFDGTTSLVQSDVNFLCTFSLPPDLHDHVMEPRIAAVRLTSTGVCEVYVHHERHVETALGDDWTDTKIFYSDGTDETVTKDTLTASDAASIDFTCTTVATVVSSALFKSTASATTPLKTVSSVQLLDTSAVVLASSNVTFLCTDSGNDAYKGVTLPAVPA